MITVMDRLDYFIENLQSENVSIITKLFDTK